MAFELAHSAPFLHSCHPHKPAGVARAGTYIAVMFLYFMLQHALYVGVMLAAGFAAGLGFFSRNSVAVQLVFYLLYSTVQVAFAFVLSCLFARTRTATISSWLWVLASGLFAQRLLDNIFARNRWFADLLQLVPTFGAYRCALYRSPCPHVPHRPRVPQSRVNSASAWRNARAAELPR